VIPSKHATKRPTLFRRLNQPERRVSPHGRRRSPCSKVSAIVVTCVQPVLTLPTCLGLLASQKEKNLGAKRTQPLDRGFRFHS
jgi:hypothetical protein